MPIVDTKKDWIHIPVILCAMIIVIILVFSYALLRRTENPITITIGMVASLAFWGFVLYRVYQISKDIIEET